MKETVMNPFVLRTRPNARAARPAVERLEDRLQMSATPAPLYTATFADALTADNAITGQDGKRYWTVDDGADSYQNDFYERPTAQTYQVHSAPGGAEHFAAQ
jgi:hypothetical protein